MVPDYIVTCTACGASNRIPAGKEGIRGRCGTCHAVLPQLYCHPQQLTDHTFDAFAANYPGPVLAEFWATWCPHCASFAPAVRTVAEKLAGKAAVVQIDTQQNPALAARFDVRGIPELVLLHGGKIVSRLAGAQSVEAVLAWFRQHS